MALNYYKKLIPTVYFDWLGIFGFIKYMVFQVIGLFKPIYRQSRLSDMRIVAHKSAGLAAQNFMISMAAIGYDTCPMEGSDTLRVKKILNINSNAEINMVISCGIREDYGVYGPRFRVPFESIYNKVYTAFVILILNYLILIFSVYPNSDAFVLHLISKPVLVCFHFKVFFNPVIYTFHFIPR